MSSEILVSLLGGAWVGENNLSAPRMNAKTVWVGTGTALSNLSPTYPGQIAICSETASGFIKDTAYFRDTDNTGWLFLSMSKHTHNADDHISGGLYTDIMYDNLMNAFQWGQMSVTKEMFHNIVAGSATITNDLSSASGKVVLDSGAIANDYAQLVVPPGAKLSFARKSRLLAKVGVTFGGSGVTNYITRIGVAGEDINGANTTSNKYGIEACSQDSQVNWMIFSANAGTRTGGTVTSSPVDAGYDSSGKGYRLDHTPNLNIKFYDNGTNCGANCTKTSNNPNSGSTGTDYVLRLGIKSTNTNAKKMALFGIRLIGTVLDAAWA